MGCGEEAKRFAGEVSKTWVPWTQSMWEEMDWNRIKELQIRNLLDRRRHEGFKAQKAHCIHCRTFVKHVSGISSGAVSHR